METGGSSAVRGGAEEVGHVAMTQHYEHLTGPVVCRLMAYSRQSENTEWATAVMLP